MTLRLPDAGEFLGTFSTKHFAVIEDALDEGDCRTAMQKVIALGERAARPIHRDDGTHRLVYQVITGDVIQHEWPEMFSLYTSPALLQWLQALTQEAQIYNSPNTLSAININLMSDHGDIYRWHFDAEPYTTLLFLTSAGEQAGGDLRISTQPDGKEPQHPFSFEEIKPKAGTMVVMDGTKCYHHVTSLLRPWLRVSVPMVFPPSLRSRPQGLNDYLYA